ncbi:HPr(Ser) kinase/phosphatase [Pseudenhygromyxa sp. WMMC2535]|uniref:HPr(Ser) kinase/phosphatase n=1 Tax=Pseudenhygromyxa sp. WMMC2535 TaxID=2712867 RepID=UPI001554E2E1|nr:HPr(Ser) kinase/phosphatase [Pseudenhygromyxa sp. WMMC2535]NVB40124.1 HPr(Ser) kinase/phosphatase [Pseudenhygromyxa sp. WMMC2535]
MRRDVAVEVSRLLDEDSAALQLEVLSTWGGLDRLLTRPRIQKPGLALSGFVKHVYGDRLQVLGLTEIDYLLSVGEEAARVGVEKYCKRKLAAITLTRGLEPPPPLMELAEQHGIPVLRTPLMTSSFITRVTRRLEELLSPRANIHGVLVDVLGVGLLLIGRSGVGKSEAALDLVLRGHRLVADDVVEVTIRPPDTIWGSATQLHQHHMEIRGMGILNITHLFGVAAVRDNKKIEVVVELSDLHEDDYDRLGTENNAWPVLGVDIPLVRIPLRAGRNISSLIEVVARNQILKYRGIDSAREFQEKIATHIAMTTGVPLPSTSPEDGAPATPLPPQGSGRVQLGDVE